MFYFTFQKFGKFNNIHAIIKYVHNFMNSIILCYNFISSFARFRVGSPFAINCWYHPQNKMTRWLGGGGWGRSNGAPTFAWKGKFLPILDKYHTNLGLLSCLINIVQQILVLHLLGREILQCVSNANICTTTAWIGKAFLYIPECYLIFNLLA
jgi:hypothetical protein